MWFVPKTRKRRLVSASTFIGCTETWRRNSPQCILLVCEKFAENPEFHVGNSAVNLKRGISRTKLNGHETPPLPRCTADDADCHCPRFKLLLKSIFRLSYPPVPGALCWPL